MLFLILNLEIAVLFFFFQAEDGIRDGRVTGVQTCALPILCRRARVTQQGGYRSYRPRRTSIQTASDKTAPRAMNLNSGETASSVMPFKRHAMMSAPKRTPRTVPRPPFKLTPPMTHAAMASSSIRSPTVVVEAPE